MNSIKETIKKYGFVVKKYRKQGKVHVLYTDRGTYCLKPKVRDDIDYIMSYLRTKQFQNILDFRSDSNDPFEISDFIEEVTLTKEDKAMEAIYLMSMLHNKTTFYKSISLDEVKCFYENQLQEIDRMRDYVDNLCYIFDENLFLSPSQYLYIRNITILYQALDSSKYYIENWYRIMKNKNSKRVVMNHNNLELSHLLIGQHPYIINWNQASFDMPILDLATFFRKNFSFIHIPSLFQVYLSKYQLLNEEIYCLFSLLLLPEKIEFQDCEISNTKMVYHYYRYLSCVLEFTSKYNLKCEK